MQSKTKVPLSIEEIQILVSKDIGSEREVLSIKELTEGWFNMAYIVTISNPEQKFVLKIAPPPSVPVLTYEQYGMDIEVKMLHLFNENNFIPVPKLLATELNVASSPIGRKYFWMEFLDGLPMNQAKKKMKTDEYNLLLKDLAMHQKKMNEIVGEYYGMCWSPNHKDQYATWYDALRSLFGWLIQDFQKFREKYPKQIHTIPTLLEEYHWAFDDVKVPQLIHWDLWEGNVFVSQKEDRWKLIGITDFERALWGDPVMEVLFFQSASKDLFISYYNPSLLESKSAQIRRIFYNIYLAMVIYIETTVRSYSTIKQIMFRAYAKIIYRTSIKTLKKYSTLKKT